LNTYLNVIYTTKGLSQ